MDGVLVVIIVLVGLWVSARYIRWVGPRPVKEREDKPAPAPGTREYTQESLKKFVHLINPFRDFWYELKLLGGVAAIIAVAYGLIYLVVK